MRSPQSNRHAASDVISCYWRRNYKPCFRFRNALDQTSEQRQSFRRRDTRILILIVAAFPSRLSLYKQQRWYASILRGHYGYYGLPNNSRALSAFHQEVRRIWFRCLRQRSQKARSLTWDRFKAMIERFPLPLPRITHPWATPTA